MEIWGRCFFCSGSSFWFDCSNFDSRIVFGSGFTQVLARGFGTVEDGRDAQRRPVVLCLVHGVCSCTLRNGVGEDGVFLGYGIVQFSGLSRRGWCWV